jgi:hypothetical protein
VVSGSALLVEGLAFSPVDKSLQHNRTIPYAHKGARRHRKVIPREFELRDFGLLGEIEFVGMRDAYFTPVDGEDFGGLSFAHTNRLH